MKLASITLPKPEPGVTSRKTIAMAEGHKHIKDELKFHYRGYTMLTGKGCWLDDNGKVYLEDVVIYQFAAPDRRTVEDDVRALAFKVKTITDEQSIMVVHTNGKVEFI